MKKLTLTIVLAALCLFLSNASQAQTIKITGVITDQQGQTLSDATIQIVNQNIKTKSNIDGTFTISSPIQSGTLKVSYLGYHDKEVSFNVNSLKRFSIVLAINDALKEVEINAGYYTVKDRERTGSISRVSAETIAKQPVNNPMQALQGRITGAEIVQTTGIPGGGMTVRIRGQNSMTNGNDPLYIVNGVPFLSASLSTSINSNITPTPSPLSAINPSDIESIEVLKDADATAIYGSRGANGVVLITTKKGKAGVLNIAANLYHGIGNVTSRFEMLNTQQYLKMRREAFKNDNATPSASNYEVNGTWDENRYVDWQQELIGGTANTDNAQLSLSGGNEQTTFLLSGNYYRESTVYPGDQNYQKKSALFNLNHALPNQRFRMSFSGTYNIENSTLPSSDLTNRITLPPNAPFPLRADGQINWENGTFTDNPLSNLLREYFANTATLITNTSFSYLPIPNMELSARIGYTKVNRNEIATVPLSGYYPTSSLTANNRTASYGDNWSQILNAEPQASYTLTIGSGKLNFLSGLTIQESKVHTQTATGTGYVSDGLLKNIGAASAVTLKDILNTTYRYMAVYGRINYSLNERYFINLTGRRDGSSRFGRENVFANFGAIGAAWLFTEEKWIAENLPFLSLGKLRASYGLTGSDQIGDYNYLELWSPTTRPYQNLSSLTPTRLFNPNYAWETNKKAEGSLELGFMQDRIRLSTAYFRNRSSNQLVQYALAPSTGFKSIQANLPATVQNTGWEFELNAEVLKKNSFNWSAAMNFSIPRNKLIDFPDIEKSSYANTYEIGKSLNIVKTLEYKGVDPATGLYTFTDRDGNGQININDAKIFKTMGQEYYGGVQNVLRYKNFELDFLFQFVKQTGRNYITSLATAPGGRLNQPTVVLDRWQKTGDLTDIQKYGISSTSNPYFYLRSFSGLTISDASFIRLKNVALSHQLTEKYLKHIGAQSARIYLQGQNLLTFTNFMGLDPESQRFTSLPSLRTITAGLQITF